MAQVAGEERHLVGADDEHLLSRDDRLGQLLDGRARDLARGFLDVEMVCCERRLDLVLVEREQRACVGRSVVLAL